MRKFWDLLGTDVDLVQLRSGAMQLKKGKLGGDGESVIVRPAEWRDLSLSQRPCTIEGVDYCKAEPWPMDLLGPLPPANPSAPDGLFPADTTLDTTLASDLSASSMCGESCEGLASQTCTNGQEDSSGSKCVVMNWRLAQICGIDPVAGPIALCVNIALATARLAARRKHTSFWNRLSGRGLEPNLLQDLVCPCNTTYISQACCESDLGIVWEAPEFNLGELRRH